MNPSESRSVKGPLYSFTIIESVIPTLQNDLTPVIKKEKEEDY